MTKVVALASVFLFAPLCAIAQLPVITPAGDPSVDADSIYALAVDPADFPEEGSRFLLDDGVVRLEADGTASRTYRQIVQILRPEGEENYQEMQFSYAPGHERFTLNWIRVVLPDGTVISDKPTHVQESDVPAQRGDPVYSDRKVIRVSITGVKAGTIVDYSFTTEELKPFLAGDDFLSWSVSTGLAVSRSRYIVDTPEDLKLRLREENLNFKRVEHRANGRRTMMWAAADLPKVKPEAFASDSNGIYMSVMASHPMTWQRIGAWYAGNAKGRYTLTPEVEAKLASIVNGSRTLDDSIRAIHKWVAQDIRYVSIALGLGGYQPRTPAEVLTSQYGDCKDKATIFVAMLRRIGVHANPVLLSSTGGVYRDLPSIQQFDHAIAAFKRPGSDTYEYADLTASLTPLGELPFGPQGEFAIVVSDDGTVEEVTLPLTPISENRFETRVAGEITPDGMFSGTYSEFATGHRQYQLRSTFENPLDSSALAQTANNVASGWFVGGSGENFVVFNGKDLEAPARISLFIRNGRAASLAGSNAILRNPLGTMGGLIAAARELDSQPARLFPIEPQSIFGYTETYSELRFTLPEGWKAQLPSSIEATGKFGSYVSKYEQVGRDLIITRTVRGATGIQPPDQRDALTAWMREIGRDDAQVILIDTSGRQQ